MRNPAETKTAKGPTLGLQAAYDHLQVESTWSARWEEEGLYRTDLDGARKPYYNLMMFPYPSAEKLHVGNAFAYTGSDICGRYHRMKGFDVFEPMGFDAFGIHSENYALKVGEHPRPLTERNVEYFRERQLKRLGFMFDWSAEVNTTDPAYYRWTQWLFIQLFRAGLVEYRDGAVNWCPSCLTVLADEQVIDGHCERCSTAVVQKFLKQWFIKTTAYAQEMLDALDSLDWSERTRVAQRNWIGRSEGALIRFALRGCRLETVTVFTTRPDTLMGATFLVIGADHPGLADFCAPDETDAVLAWAAALPTGDEAPDFSIGRMLHSKALHPLTGEQLPVYAAPYVLGGYGTGAIMAVPAHDERDWQFANAQGLDIRVVISPPHHSGEPGDRSELPYTGTGVLCNSGSYDGLFSTDAVAAITSALTKDGAGDKAVQFRLRDWLVSRQRYWGPPIPMVHCAHCGPVPVPEEELPVLLPDLAGFRSLGTGQSPLAMAEDWVQVACPECGKPARRETDVSDNFLDSSWYFLRYPSTRFTDRAMDPALTKKWLPVDMYIGGQEHAVLHLMYSRFIMRALFKLGYVPAPEPFQRFRAHGLLIKGGAKMSKSKGNVVNPDEYVERYGADALRLYLMFLGPFLEGGDFQDDGIRGVTRFLERVWRLGTAQLSAKECDRERLQRRHRVIATVDEDTAELRYNTAIAALMRFARDLEGDLQEGGLSLDDVLVLLQLLAPYAPFISEELWRKVAPGQGSVHLSSYPAFDPALVAAELVTIAVQVNGKLRGTVELPAGASSEEHEEAAVSLLLERKLLDQSARAALRVIVVPGRVVNVVVPAGRP